MYNIVQKSLNCGFPGTSESRAGVSISRIYMAEQSVSKSEIESRSKQSETKRIM